MLFGPRHERVRQQAALVHGVYLSLFSLNVTHRIQPLEIAMIAPIRGKLRKLIFCVAKKTAE